MRYGSWVHRGHGYVIDWFAGFVEADDDDTAIAIVRQQWPEALKIEVRPCPRSEAAEQFWGGVIDSLARVNENEQILEEGRRSADENGR